MTLAAYQVAKRLVSFKGGSWEVRGLSLDDLSILMRDYLPDIDKLFAMYDSPETRETALGESAKFAIGLVKDAPMLVGSLIAVCSDSPGEEATARRLPLPVQVDTIKAIIELTFEEAGGAKKFFDSLTSLVGRVAPSQTA